MKKELKNKQSKKKQRFYYDPELGQMAFGQPWKRFEASELLIAALEYLREEIARVYWNNVQHKILDPFGNTGGSYETKVFRVEAYSWDEDERQPFNFKCGPIKISWYKYLGRGTSVNKELSPAEINEMLEKCLKSVRKDEKESF